VNGLVRKIEGINVKNNIDESIQELTRAVMNEAQTDAEKIKAEAIEKAASIQQEAQKKADLEREQKIALANKEAASIKKQQIASMKLKAQMLTLERREKLLDDVFGAAKERIVNITQWTNYEDIAISLVKEAVRNLQSSEARILADEYTRSMLTDKKLKQIADEMNYTLVFGEQLSKGTGIIAESMDGHRQFDNTFEARLAHLQDSLRAPVYHVLIGETV
jgi:vacuolar-type H+-ATPase subunit E/Vma4